MLIAQINATFWCSDIATLVRQADISWLMSIAICFVACLQSAAVNGYAANTLLTVVYKQSW